MQYLFILIICASFFQPRFGLASVVKPKEEITIGLNAEFETINPLLNTMMTGVMVQDAVLRPIIKLDMKGVPRPVLIKSIPSIENGQAKFVQQDGKKMLSVEIEFLPEARWGDGSALTCVDLAAAWEIGNDALVPISNKDDFQNIIAINIDPKNPKKCSILFRQAYFNFYLNLPRPISAKIEMPIYTKYKGQPQMYERHSAYVTQASNPSLYNGPYLIEEIKFGSHVKLKKNPEFGFKKAYFKKIVFKFILNSSAMESNLISGNIDLASSSGLSFDQARLLQQKIKRDNLPFEVAIVPGSMYSHLEINFDNPKLKEANVRKALMLSVDQKMISQSFFDGYQPPAFHFSTPFDEWYTDDIKHIQIYQYSLSQAKKNLESAGWLRQSDGIRSKNGQRLSLTLSGVADNKLNEMIALYLKEQWKRIGIEVLIKNYPARVYFGEILKKRNFDLAFLTWVNPPSFVDQNSLSSKFIPTKENSWTGHNRAGWINKTVDQKLELASQEFDQKKRIQLMREVLRIYTDELPSIPLYYRANNSVYPKGLKNYNISGHNFTEFLEVENWHF